MKVKELIKYLEAFPDNTEVIMSSDAEGNSYAPLANFGGEYTYVSDRNWDSVLYDLDDPDEKAEYEEAYPDEESRKDHKKVVCFWPI